MGKAILDAILLWSNTRNVAPKPARGKVLSHLKNQCSYLKTTIYRAEHSKKPFFLFVNTAKSSAVIFSMNETAKENGLNPYRYLT